MCVCVCSWSAIYLLVVNPGNVIPKLELRLKLTSCYYVSCGVVQNVVHLIRSCKSSFFARDNGYRGLKYKFCFDGIVECEIFGGECRRRTYSVA